MPKTAVVFIHGIGEQRPLETLREFVETVYRRDPTVASMAAGPDGLLSISVVPDDVTGSAELRRITTLKDGPAKRTDFFEFYWADIMDGTPVDMVIGWIRMLVLRSPWRLPESTKVKRAWAILAAIFILCAGAALISAGAGITQLTEGPPADPALVSRLAIVRDWAAGLLVAGGVLWLLVSSMRVGFEMKCVALLGPVLIIVAGSALAAVPPILLGSLPFWAAALAAFSGWALHSVVTPFAGDVVRYVRATPSTVERRRLVRERGLALLEALHKRRLDGTTLENFTQGDGNNRPAYDRIVLVGHSLGTIIAYDILQLFWQKHGPTHHQDWEPDAPGVQDALKACDAYVKSAWADPEGAPFDMTRFAAAQTALSEVLAKQRPGWRISDFITLGCPLTHAEFLLLDSREQVEEAAKERWFATAPPHPDSFLKDTMLFSRTGLALRQDKSEEPQFPHFAAQFAAVKWTNIYDESTNPLLGDLISGRLSGEFGPGIHEHGVSIKRPGLPGFLGRVFTHTQYWSWHDSYAPSAANAAAADVARANADEAGRRELIWHNVPDHIRLLRVALRLGT
ncbi:hypothetical protein [Devosia neptuniae]|jgi:hypothetical protein|uniref:hypothetical protein n=1 Tax=Devosia TaxID=46913 RepID=UPI0022AF3791|nr:hypothetical protein [Devosia neptuniae]MCZ4346569.1 hypothetical protein [Devosia neptuniae]|tara:strand:- start:3864 stop:5570 length:1707 start_codon:yes stop_codon:yes gene_type:complete